ncbi:TIGR04438 family Trp-rich protein [Comamonas endophytica]|uniref:TIGR04438 family Trp-rich protein n=1 Tax=Comamonas endophytica TaxID=2949090 RepID=A0ABY6GAZ6_9BURK|nr:MULTISPECIES: TIGR04438 family Trp-rich protein [unclassified Acidovorax]MCD2513949.1 TIGR04438 family Trp-rich protein [Acidovorax sp. D4N7]UYG51707.1 TIGR04438 family Trp-rich protein [Acidovorax sp. 5MLIR]UYG52058.1 TIGR04438 family Trp-rich protein [Acidovorax sp. 5MLIR]
MWMLLIALVLTLLRFLEVGPLAAVSWWWLLVPYGITVAWWSFSDATGLTKRRAAERDEARRQSRIERQKQVLSPRKRR